MKKVIVFTGLWIAMLLPLLLLLSCQPLQPIQSYPDYYKGRQLADAYAKTDVITTPCRSHRTGLTIRIMKNRKKHLAALAQDKSESFIRGFYDNYEPAYREHMAFYCDELLRRPGWR
ncbi:MAG: hypothetical protein GY737_14090 [Desulfobacteraceae bacterium]|nr:hypothetical protein [Desulfobacteraceae bacterium]